MESKSWKSLYLINKPTYFLGLKPMQWVVVSSLLFVVGWFAWWFSVLLLLPLYSCCRHLSRQHALGHPNVLASLFARLQLKRYFVDHACIFDKL